MDAKTIISALEKDQSDKDEVSGLIDQLIESLGREIEMLGQNKHDRLERHAAMATRIAEECDAKADLLIRRKDIVMDIKAKLNGSHAEPIVLPAGEFKVIEQEPKRKGWLRKKEARTA